MIGSVAKVSDAIRVANPQMSVHDADRLAEVAVGAVCAHIAQYRSGRQEHGAFEQGWDKALACMLETLGHGA